MTQMKQRILCECMAHLIKYALCCLYIYLIVWLLVFCDNYFSQTSLSEVSMQMLINMCTSYVTNSVLKYSVKWTSPFHLFVYKIWSNKYTITRLRITPLQYTKQVACLVKILLIRLLCLVQCDMHRCTLYESWRKCRVCLTNSYMIVCQRHCKNHLTWKKFFSSSVLII